MRGHVNQLHANRQHREASRSIDVHERLDRIAFARVLEDDYLVDLHQDNPTKETKRQWTNKQLSPFYT